MRDQRITAAYDKAFPDRDTICRIYSGVLAEAEQETAETPKGHPVLRRILLAAACVALMATLLTAGYAAYETWRLPAPEAYTPDTEYGQIQVHGETEYTMPTGGSSQADPEPLSDAYFLLRGKEVLSQAGIQNIDDTKVSLRRQKQLAWDREEVELFYTVEEQPISLRFDAERGVFLGMSGINWSLSDTAACHTQAEADALAQRYYESLPVEQGYQMTSCEKFDEQFWSYDFCREVEPGLYSSYECVRVAINPVSGELAHCVVFYAPLLDDHQEGDQPLTEEEALAAALNNGHIDLSPYRLVSIQKTVALPNWAFTDQYALSPDLKYAAVSRLAWTLVFDNSGEYADVVHISVDYYTGEILGGATTG